MPEFELPFHRDAGSYQRPGGIGEELMNAVYDQMLPHSQGSFLDALDENFWLIGDDIAEEMELQWASDDDDDVPEETRKVVMRRMMGDFIGVICEMCASYQSAYLAAKRREAGRGQQLAMEL